MSESPLIVLIVSTMMALIIAVTFFDMYEQAKGASYDAPKWLITMASGVVSAAMWWRFKRKQSDKDKGE